MLTERRFTWSATITALLAAAACSAADGSTLGASSGSGSGSGAGDVSSVSVGTVGSGTGGSSACSAIAAEAPPKLNAADIIFAVDTSGSMGPESGMVQAEMNAFSQQIVASGIDAHVIMIAEPRLPGFPCIAGLCPPGICIDPPLGSGDCNNDTNLPNYFHVPDSEVNSTDGFQQFIETYPAWKDHLRAGASKTLVIVTDDDATMAGWDDPNSFIAMVNSLDPQQFFQWKMNGIYCFTDCSEAASIGTNWKAVIDQTGGVHGDLCNQQFQPIFDDLATEVINNSTALPCQWSIPAPPEGEELDPNLVNVKHTSGGGVETPILKVVDANACGANDGGWYYDNEQNPSTIFLCPQSCSLAQGDPDAKLDLLFGCATELK